LRQLGCPPQPDIIQPSIRPTFRGFETPFGMTKLAWSGSAASTAEPLHRHQAACDKNVRHRESMPSAPEGCQDVRSELLKKTHLQIRTNQQERSSSSFSLPGPQRWEINDNFRALARCMRPRMDQDNQGYCRWFLI
jgi:hypothetical protein